MASEDQVNSAPPTTDSVPVRRSTPSAGSLALLPKPAPACSACGRDGEAAHRLKHDGVTRYLCSSCILYLYKGMHCCLCFVVYETPAAKGDSSLWVSCAKCDRIGHVKCARKFDLPVESAFFTCRKCSQPDEIPLKKSSINLEGQSRDGSPPSKRLRHLSDDKSTFILSQDDQRNVQSRLEETLAAARIVAVLAVQHARDAKARARASAAIAARAAARAKAALDTAYRAAQEGARWRPESSKRFSVLPHGNNMTSPSIYTTSNPINSGADGGTLFHGSQHSSNSMIQRDHNGKDLNVTSYGLEDARFTAQKYHRMKTLPPKPEAAGAAPQGGTITISQAVSRQHVKELRQNGGSMEVEGALPHCGALSKPHVVVQEMSEGTHKGEATVESRAMVCAPTDRMADGSSGALQAHSSAGSGSSHCSTPSTVSTVNSSVMLVTGATALQAPREETLDKEGERFFDRAVITKHSDVTNSATDGVSKHKDMADGC
ncbi:hypothetical protein KP509_01G045100 [Ceratopteris richardii]|uniref:Zinc finger PHD-type domain-containing protein n=1 Tax=Ceratopteris richardii TaxID=49495 RepID=A0A8T2VCJ4_CERRI|nr:hypothetical protein KP509_01G045100 [Ceratopteris richardii]